MRKPAETIVRRGKRRTNPALYELIQGRSASRAAPPPPPEPELAEASPPSPSADEAINWLSPGRTIRLPIGYLFLASAALMLLLAFAYMFGYQRGERSTELQLGGLADLSGPNRSAEIAQDPMARDSGPGMKSREPANPVPAIARANTGSTVTNRNGWGSIESDPREAGLNYFILIHTQRANAITLAEFCRKDSLEAYVVKARNMNQYQVIVLPGYRRGGRESEQIRTLERNIKQVTQKWKLRINSRDDLGYYPVRYDG